MIHDIPVVLAGLFGLGGTEMIVLLFIVVLLFGAKRLPELARGVGQSLKEFKKASSTDDPPSNASTEEAPSSAKNGSAKPVAKSAPADSK